MRHGGWILSLLAAVAVVSVVGSAFAYPQFARENKLACAACHANPAGGAALTEGGTAFKADHAKLPKSDAASIDYVGVNKCKMCHLSQYKVWQASKHANSFAALTSGPAETKAAMAKALGIELPADPSKDDRCVACHVTGFQLAGGYPAADSVKTAGVMNVSCENCHGPGGKHVSVPTPEKKKWINRDNGAAFCQTCHTTATSPNFKFAEFHAKIVHLKAK
jgi:hypothetical protein